MREAFIVIVLGAAWAAMFAFSWWWTGFCFRMYLRMYRRWTR